MVHPPTQKSYSTHQLLKTNSVLTQISYISKMLYHVGLNVDCLVWFAGLPNQLQRSPLHCPVWHFLKGISCRGKYALLGLVWRSLKSAAKVAIVLSLVWHFQKGISCWGKYVLSPLQRSSLHCPWSGIFIKVNHLRVNIDYLGWLHWRSHVEVTMISCRGHPNQLQRSSL